MGTLPSATTTHALAAAHSPAFIHRRVLVALGLSATLGCLPLGCASSPPDFESTNPNSRLAAAVHAAETRDRAAIPGLVELLASDDPRQRLLAINALERITGQTMDYDYAAPAYMRAEALARWESYARSLAALPKPSADTAPATPPSTPSP